MGANVLVLFGGLFWGLLAAIGTAEGAKELPSYFPRCYRDDPNLNNCLLKATDQVRPYLKKGVPELNIPPISPFIIPEITLQQGTNAVNYKATLKNIEIKGLDSYKFTKFDFDVANQKFFGALDMGKLVLKGDYQVDGQILTVPIQGQGIFRCDILDSNGTLTQDTKLVVKKGLTFIEPVTTVVKINVGQAEPTIEGLFDGNEVLAKATRDVIHDNIQVLVDEVKPAVEEVMTRIIENILVKSIVKVPYDKLYPKH